MRRLDGAGDGEGFAEANRLYGVGDLEGAVRGYRGVIEGEPSHAEAWNNLGNCLMRMGDTAGAVEAYAGAIRVRADFGEAHHNLGAALQRMGRWKEAAEAYRRAIEFNPAAGAEVHNQLGIVLFRGRELEEVARAFRGALAIRGDFAEALNNLGNVLQEMQNAGEAIACYRRAAKLRPDSAEIFNNLGNVLKETGQLDHALAAQHRAVELREDYADAYNNLANTLKDTGRLEKALACYDAALAINPAHVIAHSGKVYTLHFCPESTPASLAEAHREWGERHARKLKWMDHGGHDAGTGRRVRVGYVSPDFREHVVGRFLRPLLANHDRGRYEIFAYASVKRADAATRGFSEMVEHWREVGNLTDEELAEQIYAEGIDILVDLTMHMAGNRLLALARKPAPVQITYLAYCSTTGLEAMDYRFTDAWLDPPGAGENFYCEKSLYLKSYWCYEPPADAPAVAARSGTLTFGCLNNFCKISEAAVMAWARLLQRMPHARLVVHAHAGSHRGELLARFDALGVSGNRVNFVGFQSMSDYLRCYGGIDIALDPFPYAGGTTTCDALWMGVPVVSLAGDTAVSRAGQSILAQIGLSELRAGTVEEYIEITVALASDRARLDRLRSEMRGRLISSPLMDASGFARAVENAYRDVWQNWCDARGNKSCED